MKLNNYISDLRKTTQNNKSLPATINPQKDFLIKIIFCFMQYPFYLFHKAKESLLNSFMNRRDTIVYDNETEEYITVEAADEATAYDLNLILFIKRHFYFMYINDELRERKFYHQYYYEDEKAAFEASMYKKLDYLILVFIYILILNDAKNYMGV